MNTETMIAMLESGRDQLLRTVAAMPADKLAWKPLDKGRTVLDLLGDTAQAPASATQMLTDPNFRLSPDLGRRLAEERMNWTREESVEKLKSNSDELITAMRQASEDDLDKPVQMISGHDMTMPLGAWVMSVYRTFTSRMAQINYIQTLYGDFEVH